MKLIHRGFVRGRKHRTIVLVTMASLVGLLPVVLPAREVRGQTSPCDGTTATAPSSYLLPPWSDSAGWAHPDQYKTILNGDVNGDGIGDLIGRNADHMEVWTWAGNYASIGAGDGKTYDPSPGHWVPIAPAAGATLQSFATEDGYWDPSVYSTFRLADIDGLLSPDGKKDDELVVRTSNSFNTYKFNRATQTWDKPIETPGVFTDLNGWGQSHPEHYSTITTGNVDGVGGQEIIGIGPQGVETYAYTVGRVTRIDGSSPAIAYPPGHVDPTSIRSADFDRDGADELVLRTGDGLERWVFNKAARTWTKMSTLVEFRDEEWSAQGYHLTPISVGDVNGDGRPDVVGRSDSGIDAWSLDDTGGWYQIAQPGGPTRTPGGWVDLDNTSTVQVADVLETPGSEVIGRADGGVITYALVKGADGSLQWTLAPNDESPYVISQFSTANGWGAFTNPPPGASNSTPIPADYRYSTIKPVSLIYGQNANQAIIGRDATGLRTFYAAGGDPSSPFPAWTNLQGKSIGSHSASEVPPDTQEGRAFLYLNRQAARQYWPFAGGPTILQQYRNTALDTKWSGMQAALLSAITTGTGSMGPFDPGDSDLHAMNVDRSTYNRVLQDVADWTASVDEVYDHLLGSSGVKALTEQAFVVGAGQVDEILKKFKTDSSLRLELVAFFSDLIWGVLGALGAIADALSGFTLTAAFVAGLAIAGSITGGALAGGLAFYKPNDPNAGIDAEADELKGQIVDKFCLASRVIDQNYDQIVQDYGLLTANRVIVEQTQQLAPALDQFVEHMTKSQKLWIWQSFGNRTADSKNFWIGWCDQTIQSNCDWDANDPGVWVPPENQFVRYRLLGGNPDCDYFALDNDAATLEPLLSKTGLSLISPRQTETALVDGQIQAGRPLVPPGYGVDDEIPNNIGILGWRLGTVHCQ